MINKIGVKIGFWKHKHIQNVCTPDSAKNNNSRMLKAFYQINIKIFCDMLMMEAIFDFPSNVSAYFFLEKRRRDKNIFIT